jgi:DNA-binding HxlR family transcriptional regulator
MKKTTERSTEDLPIFVGKWTVNILFALHESPHRHGQLQRRLKGASQRMLTRTLRNLESTKLITRGAAGSNGRGVEYSLTQLGTTFMAPLTSMCQWARQNRKDISAEIRLVETREKR